MDFPSPPPPPPPPLPMQKKRPLIFRLVGGVYRFVDGSRRFAMNALFVLLAVLFLAALVSGGPSVPSKAALVLDPHGDIVEELSGSSRERFADALSGIETHEALLKDLVDAVKAGKDDKRIQALYLDLGQMGGAGMTKLEDLRAAILDFKKSGKKVVAWADSYAQGPYYVASAADEIYLHEEGGVILEGFGRYRRYYKDGLDKFGIDWHVFRVGEYKSAVEPYLRNDMSPEAKEADLEWLGDLWRSYLADVASARKLPPEELAAGVEGMTERLRAAGGDLAKMALTAKLVDKIGPRDLVKKRLIDLVGADKKTGSFQRIAYKEYLEAQGGDRTGEFGFGDAVGVVVAKGEILDGSQAPGRIGGDSTAALIRKAREDEKVKAIVLRVDSPGGSAFASEVIRRECALAREAKKPVVVSMGTLAASGGYWISTASDEIWASPNTITGSIGIFGMFPTIDKPLANYLGVHVDGVGTTRWAGAFRVDRPLDPELGTLVQLVIDKGYRDFLDRVAEARKMKPEDVDKIARGRVWSGADAHDRKLVDKLGSLNDAIASAAKLAKLGKDFRTLWVEKEKSFKDRLFEGLTSRAARLTRTFGVAKEADAPKRPASPLRALAALANELEDLSLWNDPNGVYAHCLCEVK